MTALAAYGIALEGETDPRLCGERGYRLDTLLDGMTEEERDAAYMAAHRLAEALQVAMMRSDRLRRGDAVRAAVRTAVIEDGSCNADPVCSQRWAHQGDCTAESAVA